MAKTAYSLREAAKKQRRKEKRLFLVLFFKFVEKFKTAIKLEGGGGYGLMEKNFFCGFPKLFIINHNFSSKSNYHIQIFFFTFK